MEQKHEKEPLSIQTLVELLAQALSREPTVRAIGMSDGDRPYPEPGDGDIDLFIYCQGQAFPQIPSPERRCELLAPLHDHLRPLDYGVLNDAHWGQGDRAFLAGIETWMMYFTMADATAETEAVLAARRLDREDNDFYPIARCAMWKTMRVLYDPDRFLQAFKTCLGEYPQSLAEAMVRHHCAALQDVEDFERAVERKDVLFFHFALDLALDHFLLALFALNRTYFPSRKRSEAYMRDFRLAPRRCNQRLRHVVALASKPKTLGVSYAHWRELVRDLNQLITLP